MIIISLTDLVTWKRRKGGGLSSRVLGKKDLADCHLSPGQQLILISNFPSSRPIAMIWEIILAYYLPKSRA